MDAKFFAAAPLEWFVDSKTLESCILGSNVFDYADISLTNLSANRDIHCEIVNVDGKLVFGVMVAPNNFIESTKCKLFDEDALILMLFAAVARYDIKKLIRNVDMNMYKVVEDTVRVTDMLINNYSNSNFCKVGNHADVICVKGTSILKLPDGKFIDCRSVPGVSYEKTVDVKPNELSEYKLVYMRDKKMYDIYAVIGVNAYQIGKIHVYEKIYDDAIAYFGKTKAETKVETKAEVKRWKKDDIKKLMTPIRDLRRGELKEFITYGMKESDISCTIETIDQKNERALISFNNGEKIVVGIPGIIAANGTHIETLLDNPICTVKRYIAGDELLYMCNGDNYYHINNGSYFDLFRVILCLENNHYLKNIAKDIVDAKFEFPNAQSNINVTSAGNIFVYSSSNMRINLNPGAEILNLFQARESPSYINMPNMKWFVAKNDDQHYLAVDINGTASTTYKLTKEYANLIHVWLNLCEK